MSTLTCSTTEEFYDAVRELVHRGLIFRADVSRLTITLTGGY